MDGSTFAPARVVALPPGPAPVVAGEPPAWSPVRYRGISPRPGALRVVIGMQHQVLRRLGCMHPVSTSLSSIASRMEALLFDLRSSAEAVRRGDHYGLTPHRLVWNSANAALRLGELRRMRQAHSAAVRMARELEAADRRRSMMPALPQVVAS